MCPTQWWVLRVSLPPVLPLSNCFTKRLNSFLQVDGEPSTFVLGREQLQFIFDQEGIYFRLGIMIALHNQMAMPTCFPLWPMWVRILAGGFCLFVFWFWGHTQLCSGVTPGWTINWTINFHITFKVVEMQNLRSTPVQLSQNSLFS